MGIAKHILSLTAILCLSGYGSFHAGSHVGETLRNETQKTFLQSITPDTTLQFKTTSAVYTTRGGWNLFFACDDTGQTHLGITDTHGRLDNIQNEIDVSYQLSTSTVQFATWSIQKNGINPEIIDILDGRSFLRSPDSLALAKAIEVENHFEIMVMGEVLKIDKNQFGKNMDVALTSCSLG